MCRSVFHLVVVLLMALTVAAGQSANPSPQSAVPTFTGSFNASSKQYTYTVVGHNPGVGGTTTIPTVVVPIALEFHRDGKTVTSDASLDVVKVVQSPIFQKFAFRTGDTQYGDAVQRAEFYRQMRPNTGKNAWHTLLGQPQILPVIRIAIPASAGYLLTSRRTGKSLAIVDLELVKNELFQRLSQVQISAGTLVIALTKNTMFYPLNDATVCCSWGAHGVTLRPSGTGAAAMSHSFVLGTYLDNGAVPHFADVQALSEELAEWMNDPLQSTDPNTFPSWRRPGSSSCGGRGEGTYYRFAEPTDSESDSNSAIVKLHGTQYHVENVALLPWFEESQDPETYDGAYSFPDAHALAGPALPCSRTRRQNFIPTATPLINPHPANGHDLIGYWDGYSSAQTFPLRDVSPQWDIVIVAFAPPADGSTSRLVFIPPIGQTADQFRRDIRYVQDRGKKVLISLGGGGTVVTLNTAADTRQFIESVSDIVQQYGFDGVDLDLETPSLILQPGDTDFRHPTTPAIINLITAMRQLRKRFGPKFMIAEVPEGPQVPAGLVAYGGQFGSFLPVIYGTRDILSFVDVQNYNTPPLEGLDGNIYMPETADYYTSMAELMVHGFPVAGDPKRFFPPLPPQKVAIGFMAGPSELPTIENALRYVIQGKPYAESIYKLRNSTGYPTFNGAMFWNIESDRRDNYQMSNTIGPLLHDIPSQSASSRQH